MIHSDYLLTIQPRMECFPIDKLVPCAGCIAPLAAAASVARAEAVADLEWMAALLERLNHVLMPAPTHLHFSFHEETGILIIKVIDTISKQVIRHIPSEAAIRIVESLQKFQDWKDNQAIHPESLADSQESSPLAMRPEAMWRGVGHTESVQGVLLHYQA